MVRNTKDRVLVWVKIAASMTGIKYGFRSGADAADRGVLGQTVATQNDLQGLVIGANSHKPGRAVKRKATGSEASFYSYDKVPDLKAAKWEIVSGPKIRPYSISKNANLYFVVVNGVKYAWRSAKPIQNVNLETTGIKAPNTTNIDYIYGCQFPKPPRAKTLTKAGNSYSTFVDPDKLTNLGEGWTKISDGNYTVVPS